MKIRTDFVTNSSSASFIIRLYIETDKNLYLISYEDKCKYEDTEIYATKLLARDGYKKILEEHKNGRKKFLGENVTKVILEDNVVADGETQMLLDSKLAELQKVHTRKNINIDAKSLKLFEKLLNYDYRSVPPLFSKLEYDFSTKSQKLEYSIENELVDVDKSKLFIGELDPERTSYEWCFPDFVEKHLLYSEDDEYHENGFLKVEERMNESNIKKHGILDEMKNGDDTLIVKPHGSFHVNKCVKVMLETGNIQNYNSKFPIQLGTPVLVLEDSKEIKGVVIELVGKIDPNCKNIIRTLKYIAPEERDMPLLEFDLSDTKDYYIVSKYNETSDSVIIPEVHNGLPVKKINQNVFKDNTYLREITITKNIDRIYVLSFVNCTRLERVKIESDDIEIEENTFLNCVNLKSVCLPPNLKTINTWTFKACTSLTDIEIPKSIQKIIHSAFTLCKSLKNVYYDGTIEDWCKIDFDIDSNPMITASNLYLLDNDGDVIFNNKKYKLMDEILVLENLSEVKRFTFEGFKKLKHVKILNEVKALGQAAFKGSSIESIELPDTLEKISYETFSYCKNLKTIEIPESVTFIGDSAFDDCESLVDIKLPIFVSTFKCSFRKCNSLKSIELPQNISEIGNIMFYSCKSLISIAIPQEVKRIGFSAFNCCNSLEKVDIPYGVEIIRENAFEYCPSLSKVIIPSSLKEIGDNVVSRNTIVYYQGTIGQWKEIKKGKADYIVYILDKNGKELYGGNKYSLAK